MAATQFEINYENALKAKDTSQKTYNDANKAYLDNKKFANDAKVRSELYGDCIVDGVNFVFLISKASCASIKKTIPSGKAQVVYDLVWKKMPMNVNGRKARADYKSALSKDAGLKETADQARDAYQIAEINAKKAYDDWMEWKVSNMTPEELAEFQALEQSGKMFGMKLATWKWVGIGAGALVFLFAFWWILRKFGVKMPKITVPKPS